MAQPQRVESLSHAQRERLAYIDFRLYFFGEIGRPDLIERFGVAPAGAARNLALYREIAPQNITFDGSNKIYRIGQAFSPLFDHASQRMLSAMALGFGDGVNGATQPLLPCESPTSLSNPRVGMLAPVCRAIHAKQPVAIRYHSMSSGESERVIVPFASSGTSSSPVSKRRRCSMRIRRPMSVLTTTSSGRASSSGTLCRTHALSTPRPSRWTTG